VNAAVVGVGSSDYSSESGRSEEQLAVEAIRAALADAGLEEQAVDGVVRYAYDSNDVAHVVRALHIRELAFFSEVPFGGLATCGVVAHAAAAVHTGIAECVVVFRALNGRSGVRLGRGERFSTRAGGDEAFVVTGDRTPGGAYAGPFGLLAPAQPMAMWARRYAADHGIAEERLVEALGTVAVTQRTYAQANPRAVTYGRPLTMDEYLAARPIATPLRLYDLCRESDGAVAVVVARPAVAADRAVPILAAAQHLVPFGDPTPVYVEDLTRMVTPEAVGALYARAGVTPADVDVAAIYDATTVNVLLSLEDYGFCGRGEAVDFVAAGGTGPGGPIPTNTNGGLLSEAYIHGLNLVVDAVEQLRGTSRNQVAGAEVALVSSRGGHLVLGAPA
jgi:acetyl-CoA acetyltransferase